MGGVEVLLWLAVCLSKHDFSATNFSPPATPLFILSPIARHEYSSYYLIVEEGHTIFSLSYFILQPMLHGKDFPFCRCGRIDHVLHLFYSFLSIHCRKCGVGEYKFLTAVIDELQFACFMIIVAYEVRRRRHGDNQSRIPLVSGSLHPSYFPYTHCLFDFKMICHAMQPKIGAAKIVAENQRSACQFVARKSSPQH